MSASGKQYRRIPAPDFP